MTLLAFRQHEELTMRLRLIAIALLVLILHAREPAPRIPPADGIPLSVIAAQTLHKPFDDPDGARDCLGRGSVISC